MGTRIVAVYLSGTAIPITNPKATKALNRRMAPPRATSGFHHGSRVNPVPKYRMHMKREGRKMP